MNINKLVFIIRFHLVIGYSVQQIIDDTQFQTLFDFTGEYLTSRPKVVINNMTSVIKFPYNINSNMLTIIPLFDSSTLESFVEDYDDNIDSRVLIVLNNNPDRDAGLELKSIAVKCWKIGMTSVSFLNLQTEEIHSYSVNNKSVNVVAIEKAQLFKRPQIQGVPLLVAGGRILHHFLALDLSILDFINFFEDKYNIELKHSTRDPDFVLQVKFSNEHKRYALFVAWVTHVVIFPKRTSIEKYLYLIQPFSLMVWLSILVGILYNSSVLSMVNDKTFSINCLSCFRLIIGQSFRISQSDSRLYIIYAIIMLFGLLVSLSYTLYLGAFLVVNIKRRDIELLVPNSIRNDRIFIKNQYPLTKFVDVTDYVLELLKLSSEYGFHLIKSIWNSYTVLRENYVIDKGLAMPNIHLFYSVKKHAVHGPIFKEYISRIYASGLVRKWEVFLPNLDWNLEDLGKDSNNSPMMSSLNDLILLFLAFFFGMGMSFVVFGLEVFRKI